ncbi:MAG: Glu-tRNA(Gln) amidotransferase subunit GatD [Candidatus Micrarchaeota archaeon]|nr:Glu-tRNA(Gln) amidotransferase subunit GatD [Candidatus Micrarchaeota archaeon]
MARKEGKKEASAEAEPGDKVQVECASGKYCGILLPRKQESPFLALKLGSGYNIGIRKEAITAISILEKASAQFRKELKEEKKSSSPAGKVSLLACGGTIANRVDYRTGAVHPAVSAEELLESLPMQTRGTVQPRMLFSLPSEDMSPAHWAELAKAAAESIKGGAEGVVITHGTDTMHYTSAALSFMLQNLPCPVVLTGSQRSSDRGSSDAELNLSCAIAAAKSDLSGVFICMHENLSDESCALLFGPKARKMHTTRRDAFRPINSLPAARVDAASLSVEKISPNCQPRKKESKLALDTRMNTNVALQYIYPGLKPSAIASLAGYDGVVLAGMGLGHLPVNLSGDKLAMPILKEVAQLVNSGIPVVLASQCIYGRVDMDVYTNGRVLKEAGIIGNLCDMTPETAYVKLMWVLGREKRMGEVKKLMETSIAGEISERSPIAPY